MSAFVTKFAIIDLLKVRERDLLYLENKSKLLEKRLRVQKEWLPIAPVTSQL